jgi:hypothetical protein
VRKTFGIVGVLVGLAATGCASTPRDAVERVKSGRDQALTSLRDDINAAYGFRGDTPRVNLGPCGRFARDFRERWNARFRDPARIIFVMSNDGKQCHHVLVRLPDGNCYDGGNGLMTERRLLTIYSDSHVEDMFTFDPGLLDRRSYGLGRSYPECPNYSDALTRGLIDRHLSSIPRGR